MARPGPVHASYVDWLRSRERYPDPDYWRKLLHPYTPPQPPAPRGYYVLVDVDAIPEEPEGFGD